MDNIYRVFSSGRAGQIWEIPLALRQRLALNENATVQLCCGSATAAVKVRSGGQANNIYNRQMRLSPEVIRRLHLPSGTALQAIAISRHTVRLGPVIGILAFHSHIINDKLNYYRTYAKLYKNKGLLFVFSGPALAGKSHTIGGFSYNHEQQLWQYGEFPYPDVVIDRCYPNVPLYHRKLIHVIGPGRIINNKSNISKWDFHTALLNEPDLKTHLPESALLTDNSVLTGFLDKYRQVFAKPTGGMKGIGIVQISRRSDKKLKCQYTRDTEIITQTVLSPAEIWPVLKKAAGRSRPYIIQQAIPRLTFQGAPFSFRVWAMKNGKGRWVMPGMFAKSASQNGFLTNFTAGAKLIPLNELLSTVTAKIACKRADLLASLEKLAVQTGAALDKKYGPLSELGLDIVISSDGKLWLIEANGNPGKIPIFMQKEYPLFRYLVFQYPLDYAGYLAGFR